MNSVASVCRLSTPMFNAKGCIVGPRTCALNYARLLSTGFCASQQFQGNFAPFAWRHPQNPGSSSQQFRGNIAATNSWNSAALYAMRHPQLPRTAPYPPQAPVFVPPQRSQIIAENVRGIVRLYNVVRGFGFITRFDTNEEVFVRAKDLVSSELSNNSQNQTPTLRLFNNQIVTFSVRTPARLGGQCIAVNVRTLQVKERGLSGTVISYSPYKRFGFIERSDTGEHVFVHAFGIGRKNPDHVCKSLDVGEQVEFDIAEMPEGLRAVHVTGPNNVPVRGHRAVERPEFLNKLANDELLRKKSSN